jgi:hypothetical protein
MFLRAWAFRVSTLLVLGCGRQVEIGRDLASTGAGGVGGAAAQADAGPCQITTCQGKTYACGDCLDNDGDGLVDSADPECLGPCDNTEDSYFGGIPGQNNAPCKQDCYFDQDSGSGNDDCHWSHACDPHSLAPDYPPSGDSQCAYDENAKIAGTSATCADLLATQSATCQTSCLPLTPNGCDCFGCCELPASSGNFVWLGSTVNGSGSCDPAHLGDPAYCKPCQQVVGCLNRCDPCEVCVGRLAPDPSCSPLTGTQCPPGRTPCGISGQSTCSQYEYCISGCCVAGPA